MALFRPADAAEVAAAYAAALGSGMSTQPSVIVLPAPGTERVEGSSLEHAEKGGYVLKDFPEQVPPAAVLVACGPEVAACLAAQAALAKEGLGLRVVSLPCWEVFERQSEDYQHGVMSNPHRVKQATKAAPPPAMPVLFAETLAPMGFERLAGAQPGFPEGAEPGEALAPAALAARVRAAVAAGRA